MKKEQTEKLSENKKNDMLCTDLFSSEFSEAIKKAFEKEKNNVENITRAYYVFIDLKSGFSLDKIENYRLNAFYSFLCHYLLHNKNDKLSSQLWELCDNRLSEIS